MAVTLLISDEDAVFLKQLLDSTSDWTMGLGSQLFLYRLKEQLSAITASMAEANTGPLARRVPPPGLHFTEHELGKMRKAIDAYLQNYDDANNTLANADDKLMKYENKLIRARLLEEHGAVDEVAEPRVRRTRFTRLS